MKPIRTPRLVLRNWQERDRDLFHRINSDDRVMAFFPFRRDRAASDEVMDSMRAEIDARRLWLDGGRDRRDRRVHWLHRAAPGGDQGRYPRRRARDRLAAGSGILGRGLCHRGRGSACSTSPSTGFDLKEVISFAVWNNERSIAVMKRLGMRRDGEFDHPNVPDTHPDLKRHHFYRIGRDDWKGRRQTS